MKEDWEQTKAGLQFIADKMVMAGWIQSYAISDDAGMVYRWTELGLDRIKALSDLWDELGPEAFAPQCGPYFWQIVLRTATDCGMRKSLASRKKRTKKRK